MSSVGTIEEPAVLCGAPAAPAPRREAARMSPAYRRWIMASRLTAEWPDRARKGRW